ncbi:Octopamine receptor beta-2R [Gryllus bimaculatus]|nr:Octopamine receptor beta-2R [Gryllus bimaculatus]
MSCVGNNTLSHGKIVWPILDGVLLIGILCGNILTICAVCWCRRLNNILSNHFVLSLAVSDLVVGLALPYHMAFYICNPLGSDKQTCILRFVLITLPCCVSMYNLIVIAVDRYIAIIHPLHYYRYMTRRMATILIASGWITAFILSTVPAYWNTFDEPCQEPCDEPCQLHNVLPAVYILFILTPAFLLVWIVMFALYWRIWREAAGHAKRLRSAHLNNSPSDWKSLQMVMLILGCFSFCWLPFFIVICSRSAQLTIPRSQLVYQVTYLMGMANSCINPIIYAWKNSEFRKAFARLLHCQSPNRLQTLLPETKDIQLHTIGNITETPFPSEVN